MVDELLTRATDLAAVPCLGELERPADQLAVDAGVVDLDARDQLLDEVLVLSPCADDRHFPSVRPACPSSLLRGGTGETAANR
jgi:hypothetical protein